jgi:hypothetical protein
MPYPLLHCPIMLVLTSNLATTFPNTNPENFPWQTEQRPSFAQVRSRPATLGSVTTDVKTMACSCCVGIPDENVGVVTIYPASPLWMEAEATSRSAPAVQPKAAKRVQFAQSGNVRPRKRLIERAVTGSNSDTECQCEAEL